VAPGLILETDKRRGRLAAWADARRRSDSDRSPIPYPARVSDAVSRTEHCEGEEGPGGMQQCNRTGTPPGSYFPVYSNRQGEVRHQCMRDAIIPPPRQHRGADVGHRQGEEQKPAPFFLRGQRTAGKCRSQDLCDERLIDLWGLLFPRLEGGRKHRTIARVGGGVAVRIQRSEGTVKGREWARGERRKRRGEW
jgi:hypothetical protein